MLAAAESKAERSGSFPLNITTAQYIRQHLTQGHPTQLRVRYLAIFFNVSNIRLYS